MADDGSRNLLHFHDRHGHDLRHGRGSGRGHRLHDGCLGHRLLGGRCGSRLRRAVCARHNGLHSFGCRLLDRRVCSSCRHDVPAPLHPLRRPAQLSDAYPGISFFLLNLLKLSMAFSVRSACFLSIGTIGQKEALECTNASLRDLCRR